jgi:hypothetical protein
MFALCSPRMSMCADARHARFVFGLCPDLAATNVATIVGIGLGREQGTEAQVCANLIAQKSLCTLIAQGRQSESHPSFDRRIVWIRDLHYRAGDTFQRCHVETGTELHS